MVRGLAQVWITSNRERELRGIPIGNLTSQIFANIYLNELDQFVKHKLRMRHYFRYADDFIIVHNNRDYLQNLLEFLSDFLKSELGLELHPQKVEIRKFQQGIDFLGYVILPHHIVLRTKTKRRMFKKLLQGRDSQSHLQRVQSYLGLLKHCNGYQLETIIKNSFYRDDTILSA